MEQIVDKIAQDMVEGRKPRITANMIVSLRKDK